MDARRIFQTTLIHSIRSEYALSALFLSADIPDQARAEAICHSLSIEPISGGEITSDELRRVLACLLCDNLEVFDMNPREFRHYVNESGIEMSFLEHAQTTACLVVARSKAQESDQESGQENDPGSGQDASQGDEPESVQEDSQDDDSESGQEAGPDVDPGSDQPAQATQTLDGLLAESFAAGFGVYHLSEQDRIHDGSGQHAIKFLFLFLTEGLLLAGSRESLDHALDFGLYERLHETFVSPPMV